MSKSKLERRKLLKAVVISSGTALGGGSALKSWSKPLVQSTVLPAHAKTSDDLGATTTASPTTTTTTAPTGCSSATCSTSNFTGSPSFGPLSFDGVKCGFSFGSGFPDPNQIVGFDNNAEGTRIEGLGGDNWSVSGLSLRDQLLGESGSGSASRTFTATNSHSGDKFQICLTVSRVGDAKGTDHITFSAVIGPL